MKNFSSNKTIRTIRALLTGLFMAILFASVFASQGGDPSFYAHPVEFVKVLSVIVAFVMIGSFVAAKGYSFSERRGQLRLDCGLWGLEVTDASCVALEGGVETTFYIGNRSEILSFALGGSNEMILDTLVMKTGAQIWKIEGKKSSTRPLWEMQPGTYVEKYIHKVAGRIFNISPEIMEEVIKMPKGNYFVIAINKQKGATGADTYDVYGFYQGLSGTILKRDPFNKDSGGSIEFELSSLEDGLEGKPPLRFWKTSAAVTNAALAVLNAPAA